jgi:RNA polymerase sigma factor (sigma-70 family)
MRSRPKSDESLVKRLLPDVNPDRTDRARAWSEWQVNIGEPAVLNFIRAKNNTNEPDEDILQESMLTAFLGVEHGNYERRDGVPFTAYVKGIARNKIREARRREKYYTTLEELTYEPGVVVERQTESAVEHREQHRTLYDRLVELSPERRQVLERIIRGESTAEIAAQMAITKDLVRQHKCRGLRRIRRSDALREMGVTRS